jgi:hypothetical protein
MLRIQGKDLVGLANKLGLTGKAISHHSATITQKSLSIVSIPISISSRAHSKSPKNNILSLKNQKFRQCQGSAKQPSQKKKLLPQVLQPDFPFAISPPHISPPHISPFLSVRYLYLRFGSSTCGSVPGYSFLWFLELWPIFFIFTTLSWPPPDTSRKAATP